MRWRRRVRGFAGQVANTVSSVTKAAIRATVESTANVVVNPIKTTVNVVTKVANGEIKSFEDMTDEVQHSIIDPITESNRKLTTTISDATRPLIKPIEEKVAPVLKKMVEIGVRASTLVTEVTLNAMSEVAGALGDEATKKNLAQQADDVGEFSKALGKTTAEMSGQIFTAKNAAQVAANVVCSASGVPGAGAGCVAVVKSAQGETVTGKDIIVDLAASYATRGIGSGTAEATSSATIGAAAQGASKEVTAHVIDVAISPDKNLRDIKATDIRDKAVKGAVVGAVAQNVGGSAAAGNAVNQYQTTGRVDPKQTAAAYAQAGMQQGFNDMVEHSVHILVPETKPNKPDPAPNVESDEKSSTQSDNKPDTESDQKPSAKSDKKPDAKSDKKSSSKSDKIPDGKSDTKSSANSDQKPDTKSDTKYITKTDKKTDVESDTKSSAKSDKKPDAKSDTKYTTKTDKKTDTDSDAQSSAKSDNKPCDKPTAEEPKRKTKTFDPDTQNVKVGQKPGGGGKMQKIDIDDKKYTSVERSKNKIIDKMEKAEPLVTKSKVYSKQELYEGETKTYWDTGILFQNDNFSIHPKLQDNGGSVTLTTSYDQTKKQGSVHFQANREFGFGLFEAQKSNDKAKMSTTGDIAHAKAQLNARVSTERGFDASVDFELGVGSSVNTKLKTMNQACVAGVCIQGEVDASVGAGIKIVGGAGATVNKSNKNLKLYAKAGAYKDVGATVAGGVELELDHEMFEAAQKNTQNILNSPAYKPASEQLDKKIAEASANQDAVKKFQYEEIQNELLNNAAESGAAAALGSHFARIKKQEDKTHRPVVPNEELLFLQGSNLNNEIMMFGLEMECLSSMLEDNTSNTLQKPNFTPHIEPYNTENFALGAAIYYQTKLGLKYANTLFNSWFSTTEKASVQKKTISSEVIITTLNRNKQAVHQLNIALDSAKKEFPTHDWKWISYHLEDCSSDINQLKREKTVSHTALQRLENSISDLSNHLNSKMGMLQSQKQLGNSGFFAVSSYVSHPQEQSDLVSDNGFGK